MNWRFNPIIVRPYKFDMGLCMKIINRYFALVTLCTPLVSLPVSAAKLVDATDGSNHSKKSVQTHKSVDGKEALPSLEDFQQVVIEFNKPSLVEMVIAYEQEHGYRPSPAQQKAYTQTLRDYQNRVIELIKPYETVHVRNFTTTMNGIKCWLHNDDRQRVLALPEVKSLLNVSSFKRMQSAVTPAELGTDYFKALGVDELHRQGYTGKGQVIAIIDSGVNYFLKAFGGTLDVADLATLKNDPTTIEAGTFPNSKVIAGFDFAGTRGSPDPDPIDISHPSHGSSVAQLAAGDAGFDFYSGIAPDAKIVAVKVFSDEAANTNSQAIADGIDYALDPNQDGSIDDHVDVMNLSLGSEFGAFTDEVYLTSERLAAQRALALGVVVVAAAGNDGHNRFNLSMIAALPEAIGVGATTVTPEGDTFIYRPTDFTSSGPHPFSQQLKPDVMAPGFAIPYLLDTAQNGTSFASPMVAGLAAALRQKHPTFSAAQIKALIVNSAKKVEAFDPEGTLPYAAQKLQGGGVIQPVAASTLTSLAVPTAVSFGFNEVFSNSEYEQTIILHNHADYSREYRMSVQPNQTFDGLRYDVTRRVTIPAKGHKEVRLRIRANAERFANSVQGQTDIDGWVVIDDGEQRLRAAYLAIMKPAANMQLKTTNNGGVIFNRSNVVSRAERFASLDYETLTVLDEDADVPRIGANFIEENGQAFLQLLFSFNKQEVIPFAKRKSLALDINLATNTANMSRNLLVGPSSGLFSYNSRNQAFAPRFTPSFFQPGNRVINLPSTNRRITFRDEATDVVVQFPLNAQQMHLKIPLEQLPVGAVDLSIQLKSRNNLHLPSEFLAQGDVQFMASDLTSNADEFIEGGKGRVTRFSAAPSASNNHFWYFNNNANNAAVAFEQKGDIADTVTVLPGFITFEQTAIKQVITANTLNEMTVNFTSLVDVPLNMIFQAADGRIAVTERRVGDGLSGRIRLAYDAANLLPGETVKTQLVVQRVEDNKTLATLPLELTVAPLTTELTAQLFTPEDFFEAEQGVIEAGQVTLGDVAEVSVFGNFDNLSPALHGFEFTVTAVQTLGNNEPAFAEFSSAEDFYDALITLTHSQEGPFEYQVRIDFGGLAPAQTVVVRGEVIASE